MVAATLWHTPMGHGMGEARVVKSPSCESRLSQTCTAHLHCASSNAAAQRPQQRCTLLVAACNTHGSSDAAPAVRGAAVQRWRAARCAALPLVVQRCSEQ